MSHVTPELSLCVCVCLTKGAQIVQAWDIQIGNPQGSEPLNSLSESANHISNISDSNISKDDMHSLTLKGNIACAHTHTHTHTYTHTYTHMHTHALLLPLMRHKKICF